MFLTDWLVKNKWAKDVSVARQYIRDYKIMVNSGWCDIWTCVSVGDRVYFKLLNESKEVTELNL